MNVTCNLQSTLVISSKILLFNNQAKTTQSSSISVLNSTTSLYPSITCSVASSRMTSMITGRFGKYGGKYVPELLVACLEQLEDEFHKALEDPAFQVKSVEGNFKDASSEAIREWVTNLATSYYLPGSVFGPHPGPTMVREFQSVIGKEVRKQAIEKWGGKPDVLVACVGGGSNAMGLFHEFKDDEGVRMIGVEAAGCGLDSGKHSATLAKGDIGVYHGAMSYLLQDDEGQIVGPYSIGVGLEYPGVSPELSYLKDNGRVEFFTVTDEEALRAYKRLCILEGIFPALEASHALAFLDKLCPTLANGTKVVVNCSGRGEKDAATVLKLSQLQALEAVMSKDII